MSGIRQLRVYLIVGIAVFAAGAALASPASAKVAYTVQAVQITVRVGPASNPETCTVDANLYKPITATAAHPAPAVVQTNGFVGEKSQLAAMAGDIASNGYVDLAYSGLGWGKTSCPISIDDPDYDGMAASQLVDFLAGNRATTAGMKIDFVKRDRHGPIVGMLGGSYAGGVQFAAVDAEMQRFGHSRIRTIIPLITWNDLTYSIAPNNAGLSGASVSSTVPGVQKEVWSAELFGTGVPGVTLPPTVNPEHAGTCGDIEPALCSPFTESIAQGYPTPAFTGLLRHASVHYYRSRIHVPVMLMQGENDSLFELNESIATYKQLKAQGTPVKLVWHSWGHTIGTPRPGELGTVGGNTALSDADGSLSFEGRLITEWLDHYLKGKPRAPSLDFSFYRPWVDYPRKQAALAYGRTPAYPLGTSSTLELSGNDQLVNPHAAVTTGSASFLTPAAGAATSTGETTNETSPPPNDPAGSYARFETAPLAANLDVIGSPSVRLRISDPLLGSAPGQGDGGDLTLFLKLYDISPSGAITLPDGLISATRIPDVSRPITVTLPGIVHRFPRGDKLALVIAGSDSEYRGNPTSQPVTILTSATDPSQLRLPIAPSRSYGTVIYAGAPTATLRAPRQVRLRPGHRRAGLTVRWTGTDPGGAGLRSFQLQERQQHGRWTIPPGFATTLRRAIRITVNPRLSRYQFRVRARDAGGNWSPWSRTATVTVEQRGSRAPASQAPIRLSRTSAKLKR